MQITNIQEIESAINQYDVVVLKKNKNGVVVMSMEEYKSKMLNERIEKHLFQSEKDIDEGRTVKASEVFKGLKAKYEF